MGRRHARVLAELPDDFVLAGVFDPSEAALAGAARVYRSEREAIEDAEVILIASPIAAHAEAALRALGRGRSVFVEKPMGATRVQVARMAEAARVAPGRLFVGHSERYNPVVRALAARVAPGSIRAIELRRVGSRHDGRDVLLNLGVHDFDLIAYLTGERVALRSALGHAEAADLTLAAAAVTARVFVARDGERERRLVIETDAAVYHGDLLRFALTVICKRTGVTEAIPLPTEEPLRAQSRALARSLAGEVTELATFEDGALAVLLAEEAFARLTREETAIDAEKLSRDGAAWYSP